jgi:hypothetical protein
MVKITEASAEAFDQVCEVFKAHREREPEEALYLVCEDYGRSYGGPEEGGWWYDTSQTVGVLRVDTEKELADSFLVLWERYGQYRSRYDSLSGRRIIISSTWPEEFSPRTRPHYE